jgi:hypothetical protein
LPASFPAHGGLLVSASERRARQVVVHEQGREQERQVVD